MPKNYYALGPAIKQRIQTCVDGLTAIHTPFSVEDMLKMNSSSPSVSVIWVDERVGESVGRGRVAPVYQQWLVVFSIQDASAQLQDTESIREKASPFITQLLEALMGWNPDILGFKPLDRINAGVPPGSSAGFAYFPFLFESQMLVV